MPISKAPYKRGQSQTGSRGHRTSVFCSFCGRMVARQKTFVQYHGFRITDPVLRKEIGRFQVSAMSEKRYVCPACARHRGIVQRRDPRRNTMKTFRPAYE